MEPAYNQARSFRITKAVSRMTTGPGNKVLDLGKSTGRVGQPKETAGHNSDEVPTQVLCQVILQPSVPDPICFTHEGTCSESHCLSVEEQMCSECGVEQQRHDARAPPPHLAPRVWPIWLFRLHPLQ